MERRPPFPFSFCRSRPYRRRPKTLPLWFAPLQPQKAGDNAQRALTTPSTDSLEGGFIFAFPTRLRVWSWLLVRALETKTGFHTEVRKAWEEKEPLGRRTSCSMTCLIGELLKDVMTCSLSIRLDVTDCNVHFIAFCVPQESSGKQRLDEFWLSVASCLDFS